MKKTMLFSLAIISIWGCSKDPENNSDNSEYLISEVWIDGELQSSRQYDDKNKLTSITMYDNEEITTYYTYQTNGMLSEITTEYGHNETWIERFKYNGSDQLVKAETYVNGELHLTNTYMHTTNKVVITATDILGNQTITTYSYNNDGNCIELMAEYGSVWVKSTFDDFDDKKPFDVIWSHLKSTNNPRYEKTIKSTGEVQELIYTYTYNDAGYITAVEKTDKESGYMVTSIVYKLKKSK